jgi:hypothetical protein
MGKRQISISEAVKDIRSGMDDAELMAKYQLKSIGLQSLFKKLVSIGQMTQEELGGRMPGFTAAAAVSGMPQGSRPRAPVEIRAKDVVNDIRSGMTDQDLMEKYRVTSAGLEDLFDQLLKSGVVRQFEIDERMPMLDATVDLKEMLSGLDLSAEDIWSEAEPEQPTASQSPSKKEPSPQVVEIPTAPAPPEAPAPAPVKRTVKWNELIRDIRLGLSDRDMMVKYDIPYHELEKAFEHLIESNSVTRGEVFGRSSLHLQTTAVSLEEMDEMDGSFLAFPIPVYEPTKPTVVGRLRHLSDTDIGTIGIDSNVGDIKLLVISPEKFVHIDPFALEAVCRSAKRAPEGTYAGFRITNISEKHLQYLKKLIRMLTLDFGPQQ